MRDYIIRRILILIPTLIGITFIIFLVVHLAPGDPIVASIGEYSLKYSPQVYKEFLKIYGFDKPLVYRYFIWLKNMLTLNFGTSFVTHTPVIQRIAERLPVTLTLNILSYLVMFSISIPIGILSAVKRGKLFDKVSAVVLFILYSLFAPWVALILILIFGVKLNLLPFTGIVSIDFEQLSFLEKVWDLLSHLILPVITLSYGGIAFLSRLVRSSMLEVLGQDFIRFARAKGLSERVVILKHAFRNTLIPLVTIFGAILPSLLAGSVIIETIFSIPGLGELFYTSVMQRDYPVIMAMSFISATLTLLGVFLADILYAVVDPRIKYD